MGGGGGGGGEDNKCFSGYERLELGKLAKSPIYIVCGIFLDN